jgi:hypothetical protein
MREDKLVSGDGNGCGRRELVARVEEGVKTAGHTMTPSTWVVTVLSQKEISAVPRAAKGRADLKSEIIS